MWLCKFFSFLDILAIIHSMKWMKKWTLFERWKKFLASIFWLDPCAGGICLRERNWETEILCVIHWDGGIMLPKWRIKQRETPGDAALREFQEETGLYSGTLGKNIGTIRDRNRRKKIIFYHVHSSGPHTPIHDEAVMWVLLKNAPKKMKHPTESEFLKKHFLSSTSE